AILADDWCVLLAHSGAAALRRRYERESVITRLAAGGERANPVWDAAFLELAIHHSLAYCVESISHIDGVESDSAGGLHQFDPERLAERGGAAGLTAGGVTGSAPESQ